METCERCGRTEGVQEDYGEKLCSRCFFAAMAEHDQCECQADREPSGPAQQLELREAA